MVHPSQTRHALYCLMKINNWGTTMRFCSLFSRNQKPRDWVQLVGLSSHASLRGTGCWIWLYRHKLLKKMKVIIYLILICYLKMVIIFFCFIHQNKFFCFLCLGHLFMAFIFPYTLSMVFNDNQLHDIMIFLTLHI